MPMAPNRSTPPQVLLLLSVAFFVVVFARASSAKGEPPSVAAADGFLRACCANTTNATVCYDSFLPRAGSFDGNRVKVAGAAGANAFARLRSFYAELLRLQHGADRDVKMWLKSCAASAELGFYGEGEVLASLRRLETAAGRREERAKFYLQGVILGFVKIGDFAASCTDDMENPGLGVGDLASPVGKKVVAWVKNVSLYSNIAVDLLASIKL